MVPSEDPRRNQRGKLENVNVRSGTVLPCGPTSFYMVAQGGMKGTSKPVKYIMHCNENENPANGHGGLTLQNLIKCTYQMCWKYPTATKAVRELPAIKYAKKLGNQVLSSLSYLEASCWWFDKDIKLVCPLEDMTNDEETRPYLEIKSVDGRVEKQYNLVEMPFRNHLAA